MKNKLITVALYAVAVPHALGLRLRNYLEDKYPAFKEKMENLLKRQ